MSLLSAVGGSHRRSSTCSQLPAAPRELKLEYQDGSGSSNEDSGSDDEDPVAEDYQAVEESIYGWAMSTLILDMVWFNRGTHRPLVRVARTLNSVLLIVVTIAIQTFLLFGVSRLLCAPEVLSIRELYSEYEALLYPNATELTVNGFQRGVQGFRQPERFKLMSRDTAKEVCSIPLTHPWYLSSIIFIWTLTCQLEFKTICETGYQLLWATPTVPDISNVVEPVEDQLKVRGLTRLMKLVIAMFFLLPRSLTLLILNYLGCRWLTATRGLGDVLLNGLALEFMVLLKELLYNVCISRRNKRDTERLLIHPLEEVYTTSCWSFFGSQLWGVLSIAWTFSYVFLLQQVLPEYRWDVSDLCRKYMPKGPLF